jgi:arylsulfatase A-like enzyme
MEKITALTKGTPHDWSVRVPLLIGWPGRLKPGVSELLFGTLDFGSAELTYNQFFYIK